MNAHAESGKWKNHFAYIAESALWDFVGALDIAMRRSGMTRTELAARAKMQPSQVTRILSGDHNMTVTTMAKLASALETELRIGLGGVPALPQSRPSWSAGNTRYEEAEDNHDNVLAVAA